MDTLTFLSIKQIAENLDLDQSKTLVKVLNARISSIETVKIKEALIEKFQPYEYLVNYIPLISRIKTISLMTEGIKIEFDDIPPYLLEIGPDSDLYVYGEYKRGLTKVVGWHTMKRRDDPVTYDYLLIFAEILQGDFEIETDDEDWEWPNLTEKIMDYLEGKELNL